MFYVYAFNGALADFEVVGAFSKRDEAETMLATIVDPAKVIAGQEWKDVIDHMTTVRIGALAAALEALGIKTGPVDRSGDKETIRTI
jgi:hypothetical protein